MTDLRQHIGRGVLRLDGATGTLIQRYTLTEADFRQGVFVDTQVPLKGDNECLNLTRPDIIAAVHKAYIEAGADLQYFQCEPDLPEGVRTGRKGP